METKRKFIIKNIICSNLHLLWWGWSTVWGVLGIVFGFVNFWCYYIK